MMNRNWAGVLIVLGCLSAARPAFAKGDRVSIANDITVEEGSSAADLVCILCSIKVHGEVHGDVVAVLGSVMVDDGHAVSGDVVTVGGDVAMGDGARVTGDVSVVGGHLTKSQAASIGGDSDVESGKGWLLLPLAPLLIVIGIVWLIVWLVRRRRYPLPAYPQGPRF